MCRRSPKGCVTQNIHVRQGLGREPQQARNHSFPPQRKWVVFAFCVYKCIACTVTNSFSPFQKLYKRQQIFYHTLLLPYSHGFIDQIRLTQSTNGTLANEAIEETRPFTNGREFYVSGQIFQYIFRSLSSKCSSMA